MNRPATLTAIAALAVFGAACQPGPALRGVDIIDTPPNVAVADPPVPCEDNDPQLPPCPTTTTTTEPDNGPPPCRERNMPPEPNMPPMDECPTPATVEPPAGEVQTGCDLALLEHPDGIPGCP